MLGAKCSWISRKSPSSTTAAHVVHVVGCAGFSGMISLSERSSATTGSTVPGRPGRILHVVGGQEGEELAGRSAAASLVLGDEVHDARVVHVSLGSRRAARS
jgi:hypothetical protein